MTDNDCPVRELMDEIMSADLDDLRILQEGAVENIREEPNDPIHGFFLVAIDQMGTIRFPKDWVPRTQVRLVTFN